MLVLKSDEVYAISAFRLDGSVLKFEDSSGEANEIDWLRTGEMTSWAMEIGLPSSFFQGHGTPKVGSNLGPTTDDIDPKPCTTT
jgi:hypothetical protein